MKTVPRNVGSSRFPTTNPSRYRFLDYPTELFRRLLLTIFMRLPQFPAVAIEHIGELASYGSWLGSTVPSSRSAPRFTFREDLWLDIIRQVNRGTFPFSVFEFGVAWGYATDFWLGHLEHTRLNGWHGFDTFEGLPETWTRGTLIWHDAGTFSNNGEPPDITHQRLHWHQGLVEDVLPHASLERDSDERWVVLLDLDLFSPTSYVMNHLSPQLKTGDILLFDEAYDSHNERRVIADTIAQGLKFRCIGMAPTALALQLTE